MAYCRNCGEEVYYKANKCPNCGTLQNNGISQENQNKRVACGYGILGFIVPVAGIVLYFVWKDEKPYEAHAVGLGTLIGIIISFLLAIFEI